MLSSDSELNNLLEACVQGFDHQWTDIEGCRMHWLVGGFGPPLVLIHGDYGSWTHWVRNLTDLSHHYRVFVPDLPGFGESAILQGEFSEQRLARAVSLALPTLISTSSYRLVGFSFGGIVAGHLAEADGDRVSHLVISGPGGLGAPRAPALPTLERMTEQHSRSEAIALQRRNLARLMIFDPEKSDELAARIHLENIERTRVRAWDIPHTTTLLDALPRITAQVSAIWGGSDRYSNAETASESERIVRQIHPDLKFRVMDKVGHWAPYEDPDQFGELLLDML